MLFISLVGSTTSMGSTYIVLWTGREKARGKVRWERMRTGKEREKCVREDRGLGYVKNDNKSSRAQYMTW